MTAQNKLLREALEDIEQAHDLSLDLDHYASRQVLVSLADKIKVALSAAPNASVPDDVNRIAIAEAGVRRCFARRHEGRYAFMPYEDAVRHCRKWIAALRDMRMEK